MRIEHLRIENYRLFKQAALRDLPDLAVFVGANGVGKSTLFDVLAFLQDALRDNVQVALAKRGGFKEVLSRGERGPIRFGLQARDGGDEPATLRYELAIGLEEGRPIVQQEALWLRSARSDQEGCLLEFNCGVGFAVAPASAYTAGAEAQREALRLESPDTLAIKGLGQFDRFKGVARFCRWIERWHHADLQLAEARPSQEAGHAEHLSAKGDNLALVAQHLYRHHRDAFDEVLRRMTRRIPGLRSVEAAETVDGRVVLRFQDGAFRDPFVSRHVSDGTLKMFAYLVRLHDPAPHPLLCIEEPESQLYPTLLEELAEEFRDYAQRGGQVLLSTHSPDLLNGVSLEEIFCLRKQGGFSTVHRASDAPLLRDLVAEGDLPGALWKQGLFEGVHLHHNELSPPPAPA